MMICPTCMTRYEKDGQCPKDGTELVDEGISSLRERPLLPGMLVSDYRIESQIGGGSFGSVYRAIHHVIGKTAAVKVLNLGFSSNPQMVSRFIEEARAANKIRHKGIIDVFGFGTLPDGRFYYVMELLEGLNLDKYIKARGPLSPADALPILRSIARAIDAAHAAGIVHRDLKPDNIFLVMDEDQIPRPKILDFGIAKLMDSDASGSQTTTGTPLGTPHYMSPEQARGQPIDKSTDIYAFGVLCFEVLTGKMPFEGDSVMDILLKHIGSVPPKPSSVQPSLSPTIDSVILQMLAKSPKDRPASLMSAVGDLAAAAGFAWIQTGVNNRPGSQPLLQPLPALSDVPPPIATVRPPDDSAPDSSDSTALVKQSSPGEFRKLPGSDKLDKGLGSLGSVNTYTGVSSASIDLSDIERSGKNRKKKVFIISAGIMFLLVGLFLSVFGGGYNTLVFYMKNDSSSRNPGTPPAESLSLQSAAIAAPTQAQPPSVAPFDKSSVVSITFDTLPLRARVTEGPSELGFAPGPIIFPRSDTPRTLILSAKGYQPQTMVVTPRSDMVLHVELKQATPAVPGGVLLRNRAPHKPQGAERKTPKDNADLETNPYP